MVKSAENSDSSIENGKNNNDHNNANNNAKSSWGVFIHKWSTYLSVDWLYNAAVGVGFSYGAKYSEIGKKYWSGPITTAFSKALKPFIKNPQQLKSSAGYGNAFVSLIAGGMFTIPVLLFLESKNVKKSVSKYFDELIYGKEKIENDPQFQEAYKAIDEAPKKDFWAGMVSRFAALAPLLAIVVIPTTKKIGNKIWFDHVENASATVAGKFGFSEKSFKKLSASEAKERWKFIHENVAMDFGLGVPYAVLHAFFYNMFAGMFDKRKKNTNKNTSHDENKNELNGNESENMNFAQQSAPPNDFSLENKKESRAVPYQEKEKIRRNSELLTQSAAIA